MNKKTFFWILIYLALAFMVLFNLVPFFWMATSSLKTDYEVIDYPATIIPREVTFGAYIRMWSQEHFFQYFKNSVIVSISTAAISSLVGALAAYGFSRFAFRGKSLIMTVFLASQMIPGIDFSLFPTRHVTNWAYGHILTFPVVHPIKVDNTAGMEQIRWSLTQHA